MPGTLTPRIHLLSVAGSDRDLPGHLGLQNPAEVVRFIQDLMGPEYRVTADKTLMSAPVDPRRGGRKDDARRVQSLQRALADERATALISLRGGSWLARILPHIDFDVLKRRRRILHVFGFSELTTLVNIVSRYPAVRAYYDLGPGYLLWALRNYARQHYRRLAQVNSTTANDVDPAGFARGWAAAQFKPEFAAFMLDLREVIDGKGSHRVLTGRAVRGTFKARRTITVGGGCLSTLVTLLGTPYHDCLDLRGRWLALEDLREDLYRIDRYLAQLKMAGVFQQCAGLLLGDFHHGSDDQTAAVLELLRHHLPTGRRLPVVAHCNFGHCHPAAGLPLNRPLTLSCRGRRNPRPVRVKW